MWDTHKALSIVQDATHMYVCTYVCVKSTYTYVFLDETCAAVVADAAQDAASEKYTDWG